MTSQEMLKMKSKLGGWKNIAPLGEEPDWVEALPPETIDPNQEWLFGYKSEDFLLKQYK